MCKPGQPLTTVLGVLMGVGILLHPAESTAQSNERQRTQGRGNAGVTRFDAAQRQWGNRMTFGHSPVWNGSSGYGQYNHGYFYGGTSGYGPYSHSYFYGNSPNITAADFDRDGTPDASDNDIDGDGVPNRKDRHDRNPRRR